MHARYIKIKILKKYHKIRRVNSYPVLQDAYRSVIVFNLHYVKLTLLIFNLQIYTRAILSTNIC